MQQDKEQIIIIIICVIAVLLFIGMLFLILIWAYNQKRQQMERDKQKIRDDFDKQLLQSRLEIQEETFNLISQEIHDNVGQMLSLAKVQLSIIEQKTATGMLEEVKETISMALTDLRNIAKSLSNERIQHLSLPDCIRDEITRLQKSGLHFTFSVEGAERLTGKQEKLILFRIIQEALQNILKHAGATSVVICFRYSTGHLEISVKDDGVGFNVPEELQKLNGLGLQNIVNRAVLTGGKATILSASGEGTEIIIHHPYA